MRSGGLILFFYVFCCSVIVRLFLFAGIKLKALYQIFRGKHCYADGDYYCYIHEYVAVVRGAVCPEVLPACVRAEREHSRKDVRGKSQRSRNNRAECEFYLRSEERRVGKECRL